MKRNDLFVVESILLFQARLDGVDALRDAVQQIRVVPALSTFEHCVRKGDHHGARYALDDAASKLALTAHGSLNEVGLVKELKVPRIGNFGFQRK